jgi:hypothetical protein
VEENTIGWLDSIQQVFNKNQLFRWLFPELIAKENKWPVASKTRFTVPRDESLILDDPVNEMTVDSPRLVERAVNLYKLLESTLQDFESSTIDLVGTPWGFGDVIEYALENEVADNEMLMWKVGCYGKFEMSDHFKSNVEWTMPSGTPMSTEKLKYKGSEGEPIFPARAPREELQRLEKKYGPFLFSCNYLCNGVP